MQVIQDPLHNFFLSIIYSVFLVFLSLVALVIIITSVNVICKCFYVLPFASSYFSGLSI